MASDPPAARLERIGRLQERWGRLAVAQRLAVEATAVALAAGTLWLLPPIPQPESYHRFAGDHRSWWGIPHAPNVLSNVAIAVPGVAGLWQMLQLAMRGWHRQAGTASRHTRGGSSSTTEKAVQQEAQQAVSAAEGICWAAAFLGMLAAAAGSARYHLDPNTSTLAADRLGIAATLAALLAAVVAERRSGAAGLLALPALLAAALGSAVHWQASEAAGRGDLRWYLLTQGVAAAGLAYHAAFYPSPRHPSTRPLLSSLGLWSAAMTGDRLDKPVYLLTLTAVSGHTIKHLLMGAAGWQLVRMLRQRAADSEGESGGRSSSTGKQE